MRLLLDESVPRRFRQALPAHAVKTAVEMGWGGRKNGELLALAATEFEAFITVDQNLPYQQNIGTLPIAVVVLVATLQMSCRHSFLSYHALRRLLRRCSRNRLFG
jgi:predicted nuclease of predicted toxin-antitoxin system